MTNISLDGRNSVHSTLSSQTIFMMLYHFIIGYGVISILLLEGVKAAEQPNFIIFYVDDILFTQSWSDLGVAPQGVDLANDQTVQYKDWATPNIAEFISESVVFKKSYCSAPRCGPSRFSILTGRYASRSIYAVGKSIKGNGGGTYGTNVSIPTCKMNDTDTIYNIPAILQNDENTPYYTGMVGKWHLMADNEYICGELDTTPNSQRYANCTAIVKQQGFDFVDAFYYANIDFANVDFSHNPEWMVSQSQKFINQATKKSKPFYLYFAPTLTHGPSTMAALNNFPVSMTPNGNLSGTADDPTDTLMKDRATAWIESGEKKNYASYFWIDDAFGALMNFLKAKGIYNDTFIVFTNDHGIGAKTLLYDQGTRVTNFVRYPPLFGVNGPHIMPDDFIVSQIDYGALIYDLTGISPPSHYKMDGISWINDVKNIINNGIENYDADTMNTCCKYRFAEMYNSRSIIYGQYQYIYRATLYTEAERTDKYLNFFDKEQLYDLIADPNQRINQIGNTSLSSIIAIVQTLMREHIQDTCPSDQPCLMPDILYTLSPTSPTTISPSVSPSISSPSISSPSISSPSTTPSNNDIDTKTEKKGDDGGSLSSETITVIFISLIVVVICIALIIFAKKYKDKKERQYTKTKASEAALSVFGNNSNNTDGPMIQRIQMVDKSSNDTDGPINNTKNNKKSKHVMVPSVSGISMTDDGTSNNTLKPYPSGKGGGHHLALPSMDISAVSNDDDMENNDDDPDIDDKQKCQECGKIDKGKLDENDGLFYCNQCWNNFNQ